MAESKDIACLESREKHWSEIDSDQKTERLRERVKSLEGRLKRMAETLNKLQEHQHSADGRVLIGLHASNNGPGYAIRQEPNDNVYF